MLEQPMRKVEEVAEVVTVEAEDLVIEEVVVVVIEEVVVVEVTISGNNLFRKSEFLFWFHKKNIFSKIFKFQFPFNRNKEKILYLCSAFQKAVSNCRIFRPISHVLWWF